MADPLLLTASFALSVCGMAWLALAMKPHWVQVRGSAPHSATTARNLRVAGAVALLLSLVVCLLVDHASMASLVWVMNVSASALIVAMTLAYRPSWLSWLVGAAVVRSAAR
jgi:uncharacterized protein DUF3325